MHDLNSSDIEGTLGHFQCVPGLELYKMNIYVEYTILTLNTSTFKCEYIDWQLPLILVIL